MIPVAYAEETTNNIFNDIEKMSETIIKYGPSVVVLAIFFVAFSIMTLVIIKQNLKMKNHMMKSEDNNGKELKDIMNKLLDAVINKTGSNKEELISELSDTISKNITKEKEEDDYEGYHQDLVGAYIDVNMALKDASRLTLEKLQCDRIAIYVFHNGNTSFHGLPFFKMSCIHEWTADGITTARGKFHQGMPLHLFNDFIEDIWKNGYYASDNIKDSSVENNSIKEFTEYSDAESIYIDAVKNVNNAMVGFVVAEYDKKDNSNVVKDKEKIKETLDIMVQTIAPIVANKYKYKAKEQ